MKKSLEYCYKNFLGSGNPNADLWILGFEPGGNPFEKMESFDKLHSALASDEECFIKYLNSDFADKIEGNTYLYVAKIIEEFEIKDIVLRDKNTLRFERNSQAFYSNLFPLNFPKEIDQRNDEIFSNYKEYFSDLKVADRMNNFSLDIIQKRYQNTFKKYLNLPKLIIVLKLGYELHFSKLLGIELSDNEIVHKYKVKWGRGYSIWPIYKSGGHKVGFLPNGKIGYKKLHQFIDTIKMY